MMRAIAADDERIVREKSDCPQKVEKWTEIYSIGQHSSEKGDNYWFKEIVSNLLRYRAFT
jgi:hypothetical protein